MAIQRARRSSSVLSTVARARRINLPAKFPGNKKEAVDVDASQLTQRDLSRYFCSGSGPLFVPTLVHESTHAHKRERKKERERESE